MIVSTKKSKDSKKKFSSSEDKLSIKNMKASVYNLKGSCLKHRKRHRKVSATQQCIRKSQTTRMRINPLRLPSRNRIPNQVKSRLRSNLC